MSKTKIILLLLICLLALSGQVFAFGGQPPEKNASPEDLTATERSNGGQGQTAVTDEELQIAKSEIDAIQAQINDSKARISQINIKIEEASRTGKEARITELEQKKAAELSHAKFLEERLFVIKDTYPQLKDYNGKAPAKAKEGEKVVIALEQKQEAPAEKPKQAVAKESPAPVPVQQAVEEKPVQSNIVYHEVEIGDSLVGISTRYYGTSAYYKQIAQLNNITDMANIPQGMRLKIDMGLAKAAPQAKPKPAARSTAKASSGAAIYHIVAPGETMMSISRKYYNTSAMYTEIARANGITDPTQLKVGMRLKISKPAVRETAPEVREEAPAPSFTPAPAVKSTPVVPVTGKIVFHYLNPGETLVTISERYFGSPDYAMEIAKQNGFTDPDSIPLGTRLKIDLSVKKN